MKGGRLWYHEPGRVKDIAEPYGKPRPAQFGLGGYCPGRTWRLLSRSDVAATVTPGHGSYCLLPRLDMAATVTPGQGSYRHAQTTPSHGRLSSPPDRAVTAIACPQPIPVCKSQFIEYILKGAQSAQVDLRGYVLGDTQGMWGHTCMTACAGGRNGGVGCRRKSRSRTRRSSS